MSGTVAEVAALNDALHALRGAATCQDRCTGLAVILTHLRDIADSMTPTKKSGRFFDPTRKDLSTAVADVVDAARRTLRACEEHLDDSMALRQAALGVAAALPPFEVVSGSLRPPADGHTPTATPTELGHQTDRCEWNKPLAPLQDAVMALIKQVTEAACAAVVRHTSDVDVVVPLYRLITGWRSAFRGKADCLWVVDRLFEALLGHGDCREGAAVSALVHHGVASLLRGSDHVRVQQSVDLFQCVVEAFNATRGRGFDEWVLTTPYWTTLLNVAAGCACAFKPEDVVGKHMPVRHKGGLMMLHCLRDSFLNLAAQASSSLLDSTEAWRCSVRPQCSVGSTEDVSVFEALFVSDPTNGRCRPRDDWSEVCSSHQCGALYVAGGLASVSLRSVAESVKNGSSLYVRLMRFFTLASSRPWPDSGIQTTSPQLQEFWSLGEVESTAVRIVALQAAGHFVLTDKYRGDWTRGMPPTLELLLVLDLPEFSVETCEIVEAQVNLRLAFFDPVVTPSYGLVFLEHEPNLHFSLRIIESVVALLLPNPDLTGNHALRPGTVTACWKLLACLLRYLYPMHLVESYIPSLAQLIGLAITELEEGLSRQGRADTHGRCSAGQEPPLARMVSDPAWSDHEECPCERHFSSSFRRHEYAAVTHAQVLTRCVVRAAFVMKPGGASYWGRFVAYLTTTLRSAHAAVIRSAYCSCPCTDGASCRRTAESAFFRCANDCRMLLEFFANNKTFDSACSLQLSAEMLSLLDTLLELSRHPQEATVRDALLGVMMEFFTHFPVGSLRLSHLVVAFDLAVAMMALCVEDGNHVGQESLSSLLDVVVALLVSSPSAPPVGSALQPMLEFMVNRKDGTLSSATLSSVTMLMQHATPGTVSLSVVEACWDVIVTKVFPRADSVDFTDACFLAGYLLRMGPRQQLRAASESYAVRFMDQSRRYYDPEMPTALMCGFVQFADAALVRERCAEILAATARALRSSDARNRGMAQRLAQCIFDNAMGGRGMAVDWAFVERVLEKCRVTLGLPEHVHPCRRQQQLSDASSEPICSMSPCADESDLERDDGSNASGESSANSDYSITSSDHGQHASSRSDQSSADRSGASSGLSVSSSSPSNSGLTDDTSDESSGASSAVSLDSHEEEVSDRRAIAAVMAVAEWLHRNCASTVVVSTVQQGAVLERTVTSTDTLAVSAQVAADDAVVGPTAAAMVASSVLPLLLERRSISFHGAPALLHETQQLWDRVVRWALDPAPDAALLAQAPVPRESVLLAAAASDDLTPWAVAAVEEALAPIPAPMSISRVSRFRGKRSHAQR